MTAPAMMPAVFGAVGHTEQPITDYCTETKWHHKWGGGYSPGTMRRFKVQSSIPTRFLAVQRYVPEAPFEALRTFKVVPVGSEA